MDVFCHFRSHHFDWIWVAGFDKVGRYHLTHFRVIPLQDKFKCHRINSYPDFLHPVLPV